MARVLCLMIAMSATVSLGLVGCGKSAPPPTGEAYEPPRELDEMKNQMFEAYKSGNVNKAK